MDKSKALKDQHRKIVKGLELAYRELIEFKKSKKSPLVVVKNGEIVELDAEKAEPSVKYKWS